MKTTKIEWTDSTWSPWYGCTKCSPGCEHCYAERYCHRFNKAEWGDRAKRVLNKHMYTPHVWNRKAELEGVKRFVFPSLCDPFDAQVDPIWRSYFINTVQSTQSLIWLLLTKRPQNVPDLLPPNAWLGVTICNQDEADRLIPLLLKPKVSKRFVSCEPLLGPIKFPSMGCDCRRSLCYFQDESPHIDWVIVGGETGPGARVMKDDWVHRIWYQCAMSNVPFFFKSWGGKRASNSLLWGKEYSERPKA